MEHAGHAERAERGHDAHAGHGEGEDLNRLALSATFHCLTGCALGEVVGMMIATALGWGDVAQIATAVGLAYVLASRSPRGR